MKFLFLLILFFNVIGFAADEDEFMQEANESFVDEAHRAVSAKVKEWGVDIDDMVLGIYDYLEEDDENHTLADSNRSTPFIADVNQSFEEINSSKPLPVINVVTEDENISQEIIALNVDANSSGESNKSNVALVADKNISVSKVDESPRVLMDGNSTIDVIPVKDLEKRLKDKKRPLDEKVDEFFLTRKLLEEREKSFVRVTFNQQYHSLQDEQFKARIKARVYLTRSRKKFKLFIENLDDDNAKNIGTNNEDNAPSIGLERESKERFGIKPRYSIGFHGIDVFVRARYTIEEEFGKWKFKPVQTFRYSINDNFSEITEFFFDRPISKNVLLRFVADRGTEVDTPGMRYDGFVQLFYKKRKRRGLSFTLGTNGSTKYNEEIGSSIPPVFDHKNKLFNYLFLMQYRQNIWKKWLFYEIAPGVNYHEQHGYRPNYNINFRIDLFFGHV